MKNIHPAENGTQITQMRQMTTDFLWLRCIYLAV